MNGWMGSILRINLSNGKITKEQINEWKSGQTEFLIEKIGHPYHKAFFNKPALVKKWRERINDPLNVNEIQYRQMCEEKMRPYLMSRVCG